MSVDQETQEYVQTKRALFTGATADDQKVLKRASRYGEPMVKRMGVAEYAEEGSFFILTNPTPGTGIAGHAAPTDITVVTKPVLLVRNTHASKQIILKYVRLQATVAGAGATSSLWATELDTGASRYSSGGSALTARNPNMSSDVAATGDFYAGAVTAAAASADARKLESGVARTVVHVVGDTFLWVFGEDPPSLSSMIVGGTAIANIKISHCPVVLENTDQFLLHLAGASQSGAHSYEITVGFVQR